ncbi:helicase-related protein [Lacrimispora brassicae]
MPPDITKLAGTILKTPAKIEITPVSSTVDTIEQYLYFVDKSNKKDLLLHLLKDKNIASALVFTGTKHGADRFIKQLSRSNVIAQAIHGDKSQGARQRALNNFKDKTLRILLATDIAARGIDIDELTHVINYDLPDTPETYVHRIGRTGRAGLGGTAISFCDFDEKGQLNDIEKLIGKKLTEIKDHPYPLKNNFPALNVVQTRKDTEKTAKSQVKPSKNAILKSKTSPKTTSLKSGASSKRESLHTAFIDGASSTKKKYRITAEGTLKEKRSFNKFSRKDKKR